MTDGIPTLYNRKRLLARRLGSRAGPGTGEEGSRCREVVGRLKGPSDGEEAEGNYTTKTPSSPCSNFFKAPTLGALSLSGVELSERQLEQARQATAFRDIRFV